MAYHQAEHPKGEAIILCGGGINYHNLPIGTNLSNAMIPINGKPVIAWILDDLLEKGIPDAIIVLQAKNTHLYDFVSWAYAQRINIDFAFTNEGGSIIDSLMAGINGATGNHDLHVVLGDTLVRDPFGNEGDYVYVSQVDDSRNWCVVETDAERVITHYHDKERLAQNNLHALTGYYHFTNAELLKQSARAALQMGSRELSQVLKLYGQQRPISAKYTEAWFDFGHIDNLIAAKRKMLVSRYFNSLEIDPVLNTITKTSTKEAKLLDEINWYKALPERLQVLSPRLYTGHAGGTQDNKIQIRQEFYGYPNLAELYLFGDLDGDIWKTIVKRLFSIHGLFQQFQGNTTGEDLEQMYYQKTVDRIEEIRKKDAFWGAFLTHETVVINGKEFLNFDSLKGFIRQTVDHLAGNLRSTIIHGDYCFGNILYDVSNHIVRLIDPRGSFGEKGIYGDSRYDIAKLRHSIRGLYDYVIADMFRISGNDREWQFKIYADSHQEEVGEFFDQQVEAVGYALWEVKFLEALLFISMIPLHAGKPERQKVMYMIGLRQLNEVYKQQTQS